jgi:hypothetical protein
MIHRYEEFTPGEWRLKHVLTPEQAARDPKQLAAPDAPATPATPDKLPETDARKVD